MRPQSRQTKWFNSIRGGSLPARSSLARTIISVSSGDIVDSPLVGFVCQHNLLMKITEEQAKEMLEAAKPLIKWMSENCHPHCTARVDQNTIELTEGIATNRTDEFLRD